MAQPEHGAINCESMDFFECENSNRLSPLIHCHTEITGNFSIGRLKNAIHLSSQIVPEILCSFAFAKGQFINRHFTAEEVIVWDTAGLQWNLSQSTQLKIYVKQQAPAKTELIIAISHLLADGAGFVQYLYLLAALYNGSCPTPAPRNHRDIAPLIKGIRVGKPTPRMQQSKKTTMRPLRNYSTGTQRYCLQSVISAGHLLAIRQKAKSCDASLNDAFMAAYAHAIAQTQNIETVILPCPADLRRFSPAPCGLTVANMSGTYGRLAITVRPRQPLAATIAQVHAEISLQKSRRLCFAGIRALQFIFRKIPNSVTKKIIQAVYFMPPISYTNIGAIDSQKFTFQDAHIEKCFLTASYRQPPDFQLTISSFKGCCTLNSTLIGGPEDAKTGQHILEQVKRELLEWVEPKPAKSTIETTTP